MGDFTNFSPRSGTVCVRRHANYPASIQMIARKPATCWEPEPVSDTGHPCFEVYFHVAWCCTNAVLVAKNAVSLGPENPCVAGSIPALPIQTKVTENRCFLRK